MNEYISTLDTIYSEENALKFAKELIDKNKEEEFLELVFKMMIGSGKTTWYNRVINSILKLKMEQTKN